MDGSIRFVWGFPFLFVCIYDNMIEVQHCSAWRQGDLHIGLDCAQWRELRTFTTLGKRIRRFARPQYFP